MCYVFDRVSSEVAILAEYEGIVLADFTLRFRQHPVTPELDQLQQVSHVILAFMGSSMFHDPARSNWPIFYGSKTVSQIRTQFQPGTKVIVAIGGWGDTLGFSTAARTADSRTAFAGNVARMIEATGADGVDIDWEFPGYCSSSLAK